MDGHLSSYTANRNLTVSQLQLSSVDLYTSHFFPPHNTFMETDANLAKQYNKVYVVGEYDWTDKTAIPAQASINQDSTVSEDGTSSAKVNVTVSNTQNPYYIQLTQGSFNLAAGSTYTVTFWAKSETGSQPIQVLLQQNQNPYSVYSTNNITINSTWQQYTFTYSPSTSLSPVMLVFNHAGASGNIWLDNMSFTDTSSTQLLQNTSFENTGSSWISPWNFQVTSGGILWLISFL